MSVIDHPIETAIQKKNDMVDQELRLYVEANGYKMNDPRLKFSIHIASCTGPTTETYTAMLPDGSVKRILRVEQTQASVVVTPLWRMKGEQSCITTTRTRR